MANNIDKLLEYLPFDEFDTLKLTLSYLQEFRTFIKEKSDGKANTHIVCLE